jgi:hypothetical protein
MKWLTENWFWILIGVLFIGMHLFGHSGHGGHGGAEPQPHRDEKENDVAQSRTKSNDTSGHHH